MCSPFSERDVIIIGQRAEIIVRGFRCCLRGGAAISLGLAEEDLIAANVRGIDRIVPIGKAMDIDVIWDGHDLVRELSRIVKIV